MKREIPRRLLLIVAFSCCYHHFEASGAELRYLKGKGGGKGGGFVSASGSVSTGRSTEKEADVSLGTGATIVVYIILFILLFCITPYCCWKYKTPKISDDEAMEEPEKISQKHVAPCSILNFNGNKHEKVAPDSGNDSRECCQPITHYVKTFTKDNRPFVFLQKGNEGPFAVCSKHQQETCGACCFDYSLMNQLSSSEAYLALRDSPSARLDFTKYFVMHYVRNIKKQPIPAGAPNHAQIVAEKLTRDLAQPNRKPSAAMIITFASICFQKATHQSAAVQIMDNFFVAADRATQSLLLVLSRDKIDSSPISDAKKNSEEKAVGSIHEQPNTVTGSSILGGGQEAQAVEAETRASDEEPVVTTSKLAKDPLGKVKPSAVNTQAENGPDVERVNSTPIVLSPEISNNKTNEQKPITNPLSSFVEQCKINAVYSGVTFQKLIGDLSLQNHGIYFTVTEGKEAAPYITARFQWRSIIKYAVNKSKPMIKIRILDNVDDKEQNCLFTMKDRKELEAFKYNLAARLPPLSERLSSTKTAT